MASTTPSNTEEEPKLEDDSESIENVEGLLEEAESSSVPFDQVRSAYDTVIELYPDEMRVNRGEIDQVNPGVYPSRERYESSSEEPLDFLNNYAHGDTLMIAFGFSASPDYGEDIPTYREIREQDLQTEGNWWDNLEQVEADILLDRDSYMGAADVHTTPEVFEMNYNGREEKVYLLEQ